MGLSRTVSEINSDIDRKSQLLSTLGVFNVPADEVALGNL